MAHESSKDPPKSVRELESIVDAYAKAHGIAPARARRWISFTILLGVLERSRTYDGTPAFLIKGGVAIERRLGASTRSTKDFDAIFRNAEDELLRALDSAFSQPYDGWRLRRDGPPENIGKAWRINVRLEYRGKSWASVPLEVSQPEGTTIPHEVIPALDLGDFRLRGPESFPCLPIRRQIAQKLHAMTEPTADGKENHRFRDLFDVWRLQTLVPVDHELRAECKQIFRLRQQHLWPPAVVLYPSWPASLRKMAEDEKVEFPDPTRVAAEVQAFVHAIDALSQRAFAKDFGEILDVLRRNTDLKDQVYALVQSEAISGKVTEGTARLSRFRSIMERLVAGEIDLGEAILRTERYLGPADSPYAGNARVFPSGWASRLVRTQYSRFYNQAVAQMLLSEGEKRCIVPHSSSEGSDSPCSVSLAGNEHDIETLLERLITSYSQGNWDARPKVPNHPHCTHVIAPIGF